MSFAVTLALPYRDRSVTPKCHALGTPIIKGVTLHRDTSNPLGGIEVSRQVWTSLVRPLALALATTTLALEGHRVTALTARSAAIEAQSGAALTWRLDTASPRSDRTSPRRPHERAPLP